MEHPDCTLPSCWFRSLEVPAESPDRASCQTLNDSFRRSGLRKRAKGDEAMDTQVKPADHRILTSHWLGEDGTWRQFMTAHYRRTK